MPNIKSSLGHIKAPPGFKNDLDMLDRYQAFSAELLRISLLALSGLGALIVARYPNILDLRELAPGSRRAILFAALLFGVAAAAALLHRYFSADSMATQLVILRRQSKGEDTSSEEKTALCKDLKHRKCMLDLSKCSILVGTISLALGALWSAYAIFEIVLSPAVAPVQYP